MPNVSSFNVVHHVPTSALLEADGKLENAPLKHCIKAQMAIASTHRRTDDLKT